MSTDLTRFRMLIGGRSADAISGRTFESQNPYTGQRVGAGARRRPGGRGRGRGGRPRRAGRRLGRADRLRAGGAHAPAGRPDQRERGEPGAAGGQRLGQAVPGDDRPAQRARLLVPLLRRAGRQAGRPADPRAQPRLPRVHEAGAGWRGGRDHPVELAADAADLEAGPGAGRRVHHGRQALRALARLHAGLRGTVRSGRLPARCGQRGHRAVPRGRRGAGRASRRGQGGLHRLHGDRPCGRARGGGQPEPGDPGAGRQVPADRVPRRRPAPRPRTGSWPGCSQPPGRPAWPARG